TCTLDDPLIVEALQFMVDIYNALGGIEKVSLFETTFQAGEFDPFLSGQVAMKIDGDFFLKTVADLAPNLRFGVAPAPPPRGRDPITWSGGYCWAIPRGSDNIKGAFELVRFLNTTRMWMYQGDVNARYFRSRGRAFAPIMAPLPRINDMYNERYIESNPDLPARVRNCFPLFYDLMNVSLYRPVTPVGTLLWDEHARAAERAWHLSMTPQEALSTGQRKVQRQLDILYSDVEYPEVDWKFVAGSVFVFLFLAILLLWFIMGGKWITGFWNSPESRAALFFVSPWLIGFTIFTAGPVVVSFIYSFSRYDVLNPAVWVGLENYKFLIFDDPLFWHSMANTAYMIVGIPLGMGVGLGIAMLLNTEVCGMKFYRTLFYLPAIVPLVASAILWIWVLNPSNGLANSFLRLMGFSNPPLWLQSSSWLLGSKAAIILMGLWGAGAGMVIWLAGLKGIPAHL
ncbi:MAG: extracellular solute-binding protein, partial [Candidatus Hydrogenedentes bacterium]|nr:extracellular solute-binding protein [Candidatus Hydrogenedentota bacterium]